MNGALAQAKIWKGYSRAAVKLGPNYQFYRPIGAQLLLEGGGNLLLEGGGSFLLEGGSTYLGNPLFIRPVSLNAEDMRYSRPNKYGKSTWYALVDGTGLQPGDYFVGLNGSFLLEGGGNMLLEGGGNLLLEGKGSTFFIAAMQLLLPILVVECNRTISISRPLMQSGMGAQGYSGITPTNEQTLVRGVPCSILQGTKGEKNDTSLPDDTRSPWWTILLPASVGRIMMGDLIIDDFGQRYIVSSPELTDLGWRITAAFAMA